MYCVGGKSCGYLQVSLINIYCFGAQVLSKAIVVKNIGIGGIYNLNVGILPLPKLTSILRVEALE